MFHKENGREVVIFLKKLKLIKTDIKGSNWLVSIPELLSKLFVFLDISDESNVKKEHSANFAYSISIYWNVCINHNWKY